VVLTNESGMIVFDDIEIDVDGRRLVVGGKDVALEPKAFAVLTLLASNPGKALTHDDILDAVWGHRHVTQNVLHRAIALLRQALGGHSPPRQYIHTVHGVGYRFDAQVLRRSPPSPQGGDHAANSGDALIPAAPARRAAEADRPAARLLRRNRVPIAIAVCLLLALAAVIVLRTRPPAPPSPTLVVLPLQVIGDDSNEVAFADGLSEELTTRLAHVDGLRMISSTSALRAQQDGFDARQLAERLHVTHAIEGSLREAGDQLRIDLRLIETPSGRTLWAQGYDRKFADVFALQQEIAQDVAAALALHIDLAHAGVQTADPQVFREYLELHHVFLADSGDAANTEAETALNALAAGAPDFAPAHGLLALNLASGREGGGRDADALHEARHALDLDPNDVYAHAALGMIASHSRDWATAKKEYDAALALAPADTTMRLILGMWLGRLGYGEQALSEFETADLSDPLSYWTTYNRATELDTLGRHDEARHYLDLLPGLESEPGMLTAAARWRNAVWRHDYTAARHFARQMPGQENESAAYAAVTEALLDPVRWPQAGRAIAALEARTGHASRLRLFAAPLNAAPILAEFEPGSQQPDGKVLWTVDFTALHRDPAFLGFLHRMKFIEYWRSNGWPPQCKAEGNGARCK
jgi:TolB-like protein/DNA-binding winged helix-turn-helix (wHTH) protein/Tfp pilus assembly protein PilF